MNDKGEHAEDGENDPHGSHHHKGIATAQDIDGVTSEEEENETETDTRCNTGSFRGGYFFLTT